MPNKKISQLPSTTNAAIGANSIFPVVDSVDGTTKKLQLSEFDQRYATKGFENLMTAKGDLITLDGTPLTRTRLPASAVAGRPLRSTGVGSVPAYSNPGMVVVNTTTIPNLTEATELVLMDASNAVVQVNLPAAASCPGKQFVIIRTDNGSNASTLAQVNDPSLAATIVALVPPMYRLAMSSDGTAWRFTPIFSNAMIKSTANAPGSWTGASGVWYDQTSITLTGGAEWDISAQCSITMIGTGGTTGMQSMFIGTVAGNNTTGLDRGLNYNQNPQTQTANPWGSSCVIPSYTVSLGTSVASQTYYLKGMYSSTPTNVSVAGFGIYARKIKNIYTA